MTPDDYQREYDALMEWVVPHVHRFARYDVARDLMCCNCGETAPPRQLSYRRWEA